MNEMVPRILPTNPAELGYPPTFPIEVAMRVAPVKDICAAYGIEREEWDRLRYSPEFIRDLRAAHDMLRKEGMTFRIKARLQAEELLKTSWEMIHDRTGETPASVRADLLKFTVRAAGLEESRNQSGGDGVNNNLQINIQL